MPKDIELAIQLTEQLIEHSKQADKLNDKLFEGNVQVGCGFMTYHLQALKELLQRIHGRNPSQS